MPLRTQQGIVFYSPNIINGEKFQGLIKEITPEYITIIIPIGKIPIKKGEEIYVNFWDNYATYEFKTFSLNDKSPEENTLKIAKPTTLVKIINRSFPRVVVKIPAELADENGFNKEKCIIIDISGGGVLITAKKGRKVGDIVKLNFSLPNNENFPDVSGKIVWTKPLNDILNKYGIEFFNLSEIRRQKIITFVNKTIIEKKHEK